MNFDRLRDDLADLADEVRPTDLYDRTMTTSRRLRLQRALATSAAAAVLLGAATGTAYGLRPRNDAAPTPADTPSVTFTPPTDPAPSATSAPTADQSGAIGTIFYGPAPAGTAKTSSLYSWEPGREARRLLRLDWNAAVLNAAVSPDGNLVAWVGETFDDQTLYVANVDGTNKRKLLDRVDGQCWGPTWAPDSRRLMVVASVQSGDPYQAGVLDVVSGEFTEVDRLLGCHPLWSANGTTVAFPDGSTGRVTMTDPQGSGQWFIPNLGGDFQTRWSSFDVTSISPDGSKIALWTHQPGETNFGDVARGLVVNTVLDTHTGAAVDLPLGGRKLLQAYFQADGTLVARVQGNDTNFLVLISADGKKISETPEPAQFKDMQILQVVV